MRAAVLRIDYPDLLLFSRYDLRPDDLGFAGAALADQDNGTTGGFLGRTYQTTTMAVAPDAADAALEKILVDGIRIVVILANAEDLLRLTDTASDAAALVFNARIPDMAVRDGDCRTNLLHVAPSHAMMTDAVAQFAVWKQWTDWFLHQSSPLDTMGLDRPESACDAFSQGKMRMKPVILPIVILTALAAPALAGKAFVSNERGNTITVLDTETWEVLDEFFGGNRPRGITVNPDGSRIYVCASDDNLVRVFDAETYQELPSLPSGPDPELFVLEPSGKRLCIANEDDNLGTATDTETRRILVEVPVGVEPERMGISPDAKFVVNTSETTNMAHFISTEDYEIKHNVLVDQRPRYAQYTDDGSRLFVTSETGGTVTVMDIAEDGAPTVVGKISFEVPGVQPDWLQPVGAKVTSDGTRLFVALGPANRVAVVDAQSEKAVRSI